VADQSLRMFRHGANQRPSVQGVRRLRMKFAADAKKAELKDVFYSDNQIGENNA